MTPISFIGKGSYHKPFSSNDFKIDILKSPLCRCKIEPLKGLSNLKIAGVQISTEILLYIADFLPVKAQLNLTRVCKILYSDLKSNLPLTMRSSPFNFLQKISLVSCVYAKFRGSYIVTICENTQFLIDMHTGNPGAPIHTIRGFIVEGKNVSLLEECHLKLAEHLWDVTNLLDRMESAIGNPPSNGITKTYPLLNTAPHGEWISVIPLVDQVIIANKKEINRVPFQGEIIQEKDKISYISLGHDPSIIYIACFNKVCKVFKNMKLQNQFKWSQTSYPIEAVCIQMLSKDRLLILANNGEYSIWNVNRLGENSEPLVKATIPVGSDLKGGAVIRRESEQLLIFPRKGSASCKLYDLYPSLWRQNFTHSSPVTSYHLIGHDLLLLGYEDKHVKLWNLKTGKCELSSLLNGVPLDLRYNIKLSKLFIVSSESILSLDFVLPKEYVPAQNEA